jgi:inorganic pyrophosphatase
MTMTKFLQQAKRLEIQPYRKKTNIEELKRKSIAFIGSPLKHPVDKAKVILVVDPYNQTNFYYEFKAEDITFVEDFPTIVNIDGENVTMVKLWIRKGGLGVRCSPFVVEELSSPF